MAVFHTHNLIAVIASVVVFAASIAYGHVTDGQKIDRGITPPTGWTAVAGTMSDVGNRGVQPGSVELSATGGAAVDPKAGCAARSGAGTLGWNVAVPEPSVVVLVGIIAVTRAVWRRMKAVTA